MKIADVNKLYEQWAQIKQQQRDLSEMEKAIKSQLDLTIPDNDRIGKVYKEVRLGHTVAYAKAVDAFKETVTKPVRDKLDAAIASATSETKRVYLKEAE